MKPALLVFCYAVPVAWVLPLPLRRLSEPGVSPRLGLAAWLAAILSVLALAMAALGLLARAAVAGWPGFARTVCESVSAGACPPAVYRSAAYELGLAATAFLGGVTMILLGWRYGRSLRRSSIRTRAHAEAARITGRRVNGGNAAFVLEARRPAAYCVPGRPGTIVLTSGALALLDPAQLAAVLAHERAHLASRHHLLIALTRGLAAVFPAVPLFTRGPENVTRLAEMCADDSATRHSGRRALMAALLAMATGAAVPASALGVMACAVTARLQRLAETPVQARHARYGLALTGVMVLLAGAPCLLAVIPA
jgi:beta-lactamase regulating signal transducer with metallopeptidase domain